MDHHEDIDRALAAHGAWKQRLHAAINTGTSEFSAANVRMDNRCEFGRWFYGLPGIVRATEQATRIQMLHAEFHVEAARILAMALEGEKPEAMKALGSGSKYVMVSGQLAVALTRWKQTLNV